MATVSIRYSKDGGRNWSGWKQRSLGDVGDFVKRVTCWRLGRGRQWVFDIMVTGPVRADIVSAGIQIEAGEA